jgi:hypothetical protein
MPRNATEIGGRRHYRVPGTADTYLPSVTTILDAYPKEWLGAWAAKMVSEYAFANYMPMGAESIKARAETLRAAYVEAHPRAKTVPSPKELILSDMKGYPWRKRDEAADHGTEVHTAFENINTGLDFHIPPYMTEHVERLQAWAGAYHPTILASECQVYNRTEGYAGTFDLYAEVKGVSTLIDLKTSKEASIDTWTLQLSGYAFTDLVADGDEVIYEPQHDIPWPDACAVLWVPRDKPAKWQFIELPVTSYTYEAFLALKRVYAFRESKPTGELILPPPKETA